jgi:hypothetical protein
MTCASRVSRPEWIYRSTTIRVAKKRPLSGEGCRSGVILSRLDLLRLQLSAIILARMEIIEMQCSAFNLFDRMQPAVTMDPSPNALGVHTAERISSLFADKTYSR